MLMCSAYCGSMNFPYCEFVDLKSMKKSQKINDLKEKSNVCNIEQKFTGAIVDIFT